MWSFNRLCHHTRTNELRLIKRYFLNRPCLWTTAAAAAASAAAASAASAAAAATTAAAAAASADHCKICLRASGSGCELEQQWQLLWDHYNIINPEIWLIDSHTLPQPTSNRTELNLELVDLHHPTPLLFSFVYNSFSSLLFNSSRSQFGLLLQRI